MAGVWGEEFNTGHSKARAWILYSCSIASAVRNNEQVASFCAYFLFIIRRKELLGGGAASINLLTFLSAHERFTGLCLANVFHRQRILAASAVKLTRCMELW